MPGVRIHSVLILFGGGPTGARCFQRLETKKLAYSYGRLVPHGAHLSLREPHLVPGVRTHSMSTLLEGPAGATCLQHLGRKVLAYSYSRLDPHGAHLSLREPYLVPGVRIHSLSTLLEGPAGATCLQHLQNKSTCFVSGRLVPHGAHLSLKEPHLVLGVRIHSVLIRFGGVQQVQHVSSN